MRNLARTTPLLLGDSIRRAFGGAVTAAPSGTKTISSGFVFAWRSLMAGEMLFVSLGLGHLLMMGRELNDIKQIFAVMVVIVAIGMIVDKQLFGFFERKIRVRWGLISA